jgi:hypothetical protein
MVEELEADARVWLPMPHLKEASGIPLLVNHTACARHQPHAFVYQSRTTCVSTLHPTLLTHLMLLRPLPATTFTHNPAPT